MCGASSPFITTSRRARSMRFGNADLLHKFLEVIEVKSEPSSPSTPPLGWAEEVKSTPSPPSSSPPGRVEVAGAAPKLTPQPPPTPPPGWLLNAKNHAASREHPRRKQISPTTRTSPRIRQDVIGLKPRSKHSLAVADRRHVTDALKRVSFSTSSAALAIGAEMPCERSKFC